MRDVAHHNVCDVACWIKIHYLLHKKEKENSMFYVKQNNEESYPLIIKHLFIYCHKLKILFPFVADFRHGRYYYHVLKKFDVMEKVEMS